MALQLEDYVFPEIFFVANTDFEEGKPSSWDGLDVRAFPRINEEDEKFLLQVDVSIDATEDNNSPYDFKITGLIYFDFPGEEDLEIRGSKGFYNSAAILYTAIRDQVMTLSSRSIYGRVIIPPHYFNKDSFITESNEEKEDSK